MVEDAAIEEENAEFYFEIYILVFFKKIGRRFVL